MQPREAGPSLPLGFGPLGIDLESNHQIRPTAEGRCWAVLIVWWAVVCDIAMCFAPATGRNTELLTGVSSWTYGYDVTATVTRQGLLFVGRIP